MGWSALSPLSQETDLNMPESDWAITRLRWWSSWHLKPFMVFSLFPDEWCGLLILNILLDLGPTWSLSVFWCRLSQFWIWGSLECREHKFEKPGNINSQNSTSLFIFKILSARSSNSILCYKQGINIPSSKGQGNYLLKRIRACFVLNDILAPIWISRGEVNGMTRNRRGSEILKNTY